MTPGSVDPQELAALQARYQPRFAALWAAVQAATGPAQLTATTGGVQAPLPAIAQPQPGDRRFAAREWSELPYFALLKQSYLLAGEYTRELATLARLPAAEQRRLDFATRQAIDALAPCNYAATNPEVIKRALATGGESVAQGWANLAGDLAKGRISMTDERAFTVGGNLAVTAGDVVYRNELIELIQYRATTPNVHRRPVVIVPPCINKYYVLDLRPENSFVRWAVAQGHTVFIISWRNIGGGQGTTRWDDYLAEGVLAALAIARAICGADTVNAIGYCVGGTLLASALAVEAARGARSVASLTLFASLLDFSDPGDIAVYISRDELALREPLLMAGERIHGREIAAAFSTLRANDLIWNYVVRNYLKGETPSPFDLLYWNGDGANLAGPMYVYYLRNFYLDNLLRERGALTMCGDRVDLSRIGVPSYVLATQDDHIVPWKGAWRSTLLLGGRSTFVLAASGHIAGVIAPPAKGGRGYRVNAGEAPDADAWLAGSRAETGSWWPHWAAWLAPHAGVGRRAPKATGNAALPPLEAAPGRYVLEAAD